MQANRTRSTIGPEQRMRRARLMLRYKRRKARA